MNILVTGASGQLGTTIRSMAEGLEGDLNFVFTASSDLDITDYEEVHYALNKQHFSYCINCAGYTQVDNAETQTELAQRINTSGARNLALNCADTDTVLIHISTDFVFDGYLNEPYREEDLARPIGFYGDTKYKGERAIINNLEKHFILRTSWLYSEFGNNFMKTMIRLGSEREELSVVYDQVGTPTYAKDLAHLIFHIISSKSNAFGVYHYSNEGVASWYDFAHAIFKAQKLAVHLFPILSSEYPTPAERPKFSVLDKTKVKSTFGISVPYWKDSLTIALKAYSKVSV